MSWRLLWFPRWIFSFPFRKLPSDKSTVGLWKRRLEERRPGNGKKNRLDVLFKFRLNSIIRQQHGIFWEKNNVNKQIRLIRFSNILLSVTTRLSFILWVEFKKSVLFCFQLTRIFHIQAYLNILNLFFSLTFSSVFCTSFEAFSTTKIHF